MRFESDIVGFRILTIQDIEVEQRDERFVKSEWPEVVFGAELPTVSIPEMTVSTSSARDWNVEILLPGDAPSEEEKSSPSPPPPTNPDQA